MSNRNVFIEECVGVLRQGVCVLERIDARLYAGASSSLARAPLGAHFRHCLDFFQCLLEGLPAGRVDYNLRERDALVESDRAAAVARMEETIAALSSFVDVNPESSLLVATEGFDADGDETVWCRSTLARELQFLLSHTTHHFALVALLLRAQGFEPGEEFGVNPSTLRHWRRQEAEAACVL